LTGSVSCRTDRGAGFDGRQGTRGGTAEWRRLSDREETMATESVVVGALDLIVKGVSAPSAPRVAGLEAADRRLEAADHVADLRRILGSKNVVGVGVAE